MSPTDHDRSSELLPAYLDEELDARDSAWLASHLETCSDCREELVGLRALRVGGDPLNDLERARLHREVFDELGLMTGESTVSSRPWGQRAAQVLGAVATVALLLGGLVYLGSGTTGGDDSAGQSAGGDGDTSMEAATGDQGLADSGAAAGGEAPQALRAKDVAPPEATYEADLGTVEDQALKKLGRRSQPFIGFTAVEVTSAEGMRDGFLEDLVGQAPDEVSGQLRDCATEVLNQIPTAVATYAAPARYGDPPRNVLVIGFAYSFTEQGFLDQYQLWIYPRGSCDFPTNYVGGQIRP